MLYCSSRRKDNIRFCPSSRRQTLSRRFCRPFDTLGTYTNPNSHNVGPTPRLKNEPQSIPPGACLTDLPDRTFKRCRHAARLCIPRSGSSDVALPLSNATSSHRVFVCQIASPKRALALSDRYPIKRPRSRSSFPHSKGKCPRV